MPFLPSVTFRQSQTNRLCSRYTSKFQFSIPLINSCQNFATSMNHYELSLFNSKTLSELTCKVQSSLGISSTGSSQDLQVACWAPTNKVNSMDLSRLCSVISAYRLFDVIAMLEGGHRAPTVDRHFVEISSSAFRVSR